MKIAVLVIALLFTGDAMSASVHRYENMNTREILALDETRVVVIVPGGILEEHGPYLPSGTDTLMSTHASERVAHALAHAGHDVLLLPVIYLGSDGAEVIGRHDMFPGSLTVQPETLRQVYMDIGDALGKAGFRNVFLVNIHGAPRQNVMLDMAADYFNDTWGGKMVHLYGLMPVQEQWRAAREAMSEEAIAAQGFSVHSSAVEHSAIMHLAPEQVADDVTDAPDWRAEDFPGMVALARKPDWPGYFGAPRYASAAAGKQAMTAITDSMTRIALEILDGAKIGNYPRFSDSPAARNAPQSPMDLQRKRQAAWLDKVRR